MDDDDKQNSKRITQVGVYITIPFVLAFTPLMGWWIGRWLDQKLNTAPFLMYLFILLGFVAGFREVYRIIKRFGNGI